MKSLLKSDFGRLFKNKLFYISVIASLLGGVYSANNLRFDAGICCIDDGYDSLVFIPLMIISILIPFIICDDYSSGMIRNKISTGHSRNEIYLSGLITSLSAITINFALHLLGYFPVAIMWFGAEFRVEDHYPYERYIVLLALYLMMIAYSSVSHFVSTLISKKAIVVVALISSMMIYLVFFEMFIIMSVYSSRTTYELVEETSDNGTHVETYVEVENDMYKPEGSIEKTVGRILNVGVVVAQDVPITAFDMQTIAFIIPYNLAVTVGLSTVGAYIFKYKDLK